MELEKTAYDGSLPQHSKEVDGCCYQAVPHRQTHTRTPQGQVQSRREAGTQSCWGEGKMRKDGARNGNKRGSPIQSIKNSDPRMGRHRPRMINGSTKEIQINGDWGLLAPASPPPFCQHISSSVDENPPYPLLLFFPFMAPPSWASLEQNEFLCEENTKWDFIKSGSTTLKSFYTQTTNTFLQKWPAAPDEITLAEADGDPVRAQRLVYDFWYKVSPPTSYNFYVLLLY